MNVLSIEWWSVRPRFNLYPRTRHAIIGMLRLAPSACGRRDVKINLVHLALAGAHVARATPLITDSDNCRWSVEWPRDASRLSTYHSIVISTVRQQLIFWYFLKIWNSDFKIDDEKKIYRVNSVFYFSTPSNIVVKFKETLEKNCCT